MGRTANRCLAALGTAAWLLAGCSPAEDATAPAPAEPAAPTSTTAAPEAPPAERLNLVLVVICSLRWEHLGFAGYARDTTPFLDSLAETGVLFTNAVASSTWTKPTTASLLTGLTPNVHGLTDYYSAEAIRERGFTPKHTLADEVETLPETLAAAGFATWGRSNNIHAGHFFNLMQGFDDAGPAISEAETPELLGELERWLEEVPAEQPFFAFLLTRDAHVTYFPAYEGYARFASEPVPEDEYDEFPFELKRRLKEAEQSGAPIAEAQQRHWIDLYDAELAQLDAALAELPGVLERTGRAGRTVIALTADHGERFFDPHGAISHGGPIFDEPLVHVPLLFHGPGVPEAVRVRQVVRSIDVFPTLAALAEAPAPDVLQGRSLVPLLTGVGGLPQVSAFASFDEQAHAVRLGRHKLQQRADGSYSLHDLVADPRELEDRVADDPENLETLRSELERWLVEEEALRPLVVRGGARELTPEVIEQLRELGYVEPAEPPGAVDAERGLQGEEEEER